MLKKIIFYSTILLVALMSVGTLFGIFYAKTYSQESPSWTIQAIGQDLGTLAIVIPALIVVAYFATKGSLRAYLIWIGLLLYVIYAYIIYAFFVHFNFLFLIYIGILGVSFYTLIFAIKNTKFELILAALEQNLPIKLTYRFLMWFAAIFACLWLSEIIPALAIGKTPQSIIDAGLITNPVYVLDLVFFFPGVFIIGYLLKKRNVLGIFFAVPILVFNVTMGLPSMGAAIILAIKGMQIAYTPIIVMGIVSILSVIITVLFLKNVKRNLAN